MAKTVTVTLGGEDFVVPQFNIAQHERMVDIFTDVSSGRRPIAILKLALGEATPARTPEEVAKTPGDMDEIAAAVTSILALSGYAPSVVKDAPPPAD
jgi:hypothetical protein